MLVKKALPPGAYASDPNGQKYKKTVQVPVVNQICHGQRPLPCVTMAALRRLNHDADVAFGHDKSSTVAGGRGVSRHKNFPNNFGRVFFLIVVSRTNIFGLLHLILPKPKKTKSLKTSAHVGSG